MTKLVRDSTAQALTLTIQTTLQWDNKENLAKDYKYARHTHMHAYKYISIFVSTYSEIHEKKTIRKLNQKGHKKSIITSSASVRVASASVAIVLVPDYEKSLA